MLKPLIRWLQDDGWDVYQEVETPSGVADIVAKMSHGKLELVWVIEGKKTMGEAVLHQATHHLRHAHLVSVAVPRNTNSIYHDYCENKGRRCRSLIR